LADLPKEVKFHEIRNNNRRKTKNRNVFPNDTAIFKLLYLAVIEIKKKWVIRMKDWNQ